MRRGDELIAIVGDPTTDSVALDVASTELVNEFLRGFPLEELRRLLHSDSTRIVQSGTWIAAEMGSEALPLLDEVPALLVHPDRQVRYFALDIVLTSASAEHETLVAQAVSLIEDPDQAVKSRATWFLAYAQTSVLAASIPFLVGPVQAAVEWLTRDPSADEVVRTLDSEADLSRLAAVAAATRQSDSAPSLLKLAAESGDSLVSRFARHQLERQSLRR